MVKIIYKMLRRDMIQTMQKANFGNQIIDTVLNAFELRDTKEDFERSKLPRYNPPPPPKKRA